MRLAQSLQLIIDHGFGRDHRRTDEIEPFVGELADLRGYLEARLVREGCVLFELTRFDLRLVYGLYVLVRESPRERRCNERVHDVVRDLRTVEVHQDLTRSLTRAESTHARLLLKVSVNLLDLHLHRVSGDLDGDLHHDR